MSSRPDYIKCILVDNISARTLGTRHAWCGRHLSRMEWSFLSIDHAALAGVNGSGQVPCGECVEAVRKALLPEESQP